jgi:hypothetical protein
MAFAAALWTAFPRPIPGVQGGYGLSARLISSFSLSSPSLLLKD